MKSSSLSSLVILVCLNLTLISCDNTGDDSSSLANLNISANNNIDDGSSYQNSKTDISIPYTSIPLDISNGIVLSDAIAYLNVDGDSDTDVFMATGQVGIEGEVDSQLFINNGSNVFTFNNTLFGGDIPQATHARKSIVADFNNDDLQDIFVFDHGFDFYPFPGNRPKLILQGDVITWKKMDETGFHHGGAAADIDNDGDIDIFVGGFTPFFYINDGAANFEKADNRFDKSIDKVFSAELIDVDSDGFIDLIVGAHEQDGDETSVYWGNTKGSYSKNLRTVLPAFQKYGTVLDFEAEDLDGDGEKDIVVNRTGGGNNNFYVGRRTQLLNNNGDRSFTDVSSNIDTTGPDNWFPWLRAQDINDDGHVDIFSDDRDDDVVYINNGSGNFTFQNFTGMPTTGIPMNIP